MQSCAQRNHLLLEPRTAKSSGQRLHVTYRALKVGSCPYGDNSVQIFMSPFPCCI